MISITCSYSTDSKNRGDILIVKKQGENALNFGILDNGEELNIIVKQEDALRLAREILNYYEGLDSSYSGSLP